MAKISIENVGSAVRKVQAMSPSEQLSLADEIFERQPNLMASCLVQHQLGVANGGLEHTSVSANCVAYGLGDESVQS